MAGSHMWFEAETPLREAIKALREDDPDLLKRLRLLRVHINKLPLADSRDEYRGRPPKGDPFLHYGVFPSDGKLEKVQSPGLAHEFVKECEVYFLCRGIQLRIRKSIQQTVSWLYLACPSGIVEHVRQNLERKLSDTSQVDLHTIGLCFENSADIKLFFAALERLFQLRHTGINNWLRASRNIVRFRDYALQPEIVSRGRLENIISGLLRSLENEVRASNFKKKFDNCVLSSLYLLKRRRYETDFLASDSNHFKRLDNIFSKILSIRKNRLSARQFTIVSVTLKFLRQEASYADLKGIMIEV